MHGGPPGWLAGWQTTLMRNGNRWYPLQPIIQTMLIDMVQSYASDLHPEERPVQGGSR